MLKEIDGYARKWKTMEGTADEWKTMEGVPDGWVINDEGDAVFDHAGYLKLHGGSSVRLDQFKRVPPSDH